MFIYPIILILKDLFNCLHIVLSILLCLGDLLMRNVSVMNTTQHFFADKGE